MITDIKIALPEWKGIYDWSIEAEEVGPPNG
jgi:hypothetical protein